MNILVVDIGGTNIKILATGHDTGRKFSSGREMTPVQMVAMVKEQTTDWEYDVVTLGYPGIVRNGHIVAEPQNLASGWIGFDFERAFGRPVKIQNDGAMQALGGYQGGTLLFIGLGTGLAAALVIDGVALPMELGRLGYRKKTYEDFLGVRGLERLGKTKWQKYVEHGIARLVEAFHPDDVVIGGGNVKKLVRLPAGCRAGDNYNAFLGGYRLWDESAAGDHAAAHAG